MRIATLIISQLILREMYGDHSGEFVYVSWGLIVI